MPMLKLACKTIIFISILLTIDYLLSSVMKSGLGKQYGFAAQAEIVCIGNSKMDVALDGEQIRKKLNVTIAKFCLHGLPDDDFNLLLKYYLDTSKSRPRVILYSLGSESLAATGRISQNHYQLLYPFMDDNNIAAFLKSSENNISDYYFKKFIRTRRYNNYMQNIAMRGHLNSPPAISRVSLPEPRIPAGNGQGAIWDQRIDTQRLAYLDQAARIAGSYGSRLVFVYLPNYRSDKNVEQAVYNKLDELKKHFAGNPNVSVYDRLNSYQSRNDLFSDGAHFNYDGSQRATGDILSLLPALLR